ncbi:MAG: hypothetical protein ACFFEK_02915 [Candidatus Thorarchaeota archaeon]
MTEDGSFKKTISIAGQISEENYCPFSRGKWKRAGDALVFFMLFVTPLLWVISLIVTNLF